MKGYPKLFGWTLILTAFGLLLSGLLLIPSMLDFRLEMDVPWRLGASARLMTAALHAGVAFLMLMFLGALWSVHMRGHWRKGKHRVSGSLLVSSFVLMALTGLGIYYFGGEGLSLGASIAHVGAGLFGTGLFLWHGIRGYRARTAKDARHKARQVARKTPLTLVASRAEEAAEEVGVKEVSGPSA
ncbi:hypothetical protein [Kordiimonas marina]|uniref:hypothetical protein n=1 Tax=Kordiimonas marina TaxID=2872312 RepID=UPI001FF46492|nr:hypothetical protein [Kordiimonas marina]MCJ9428657.1 hypothetical protein [Kordiimonas marina]